MGLFDTFKIAAKCPYCGDDSVKDFQTKRFNCDMMEWNKGDFFDERFKKTEKTLMVVSNVYTSCDSCKGFIIADVSIIDNVVDSAWNLRTEKIFEQSGQSRY